MIIAGAADIGGSNTRVGLVSEKGEIIGYHRFTTPKGEDPALITDAVIYHLKKLCQEAGLLSLCSVGVSVAGPVNSQSGVISHPPNLPYEEVPVIFPLQNGLGCQVSLLNDCAAAVLGEVTCGGARDYEHVVYITISTGIGGGVFTGGVLLTGRDGNAAEIGHLLVDTTYNLTCSCNYTGHWEGYASGSRIPYFFKEWCLKNGFQVRKEDLSADEIIKEGLGGDPISAGFLEELAVINGRGLSSVIVAYDPEVIIIDGPVIQNHPEIITMAVRRTDLYLSLPKISLSPLKGNAPLIGAGIGSLIKYGGLKIHKRNFFQTW